MDPGSGHVERAAHAQPAPVEDVGVDHRGGHFAVAEQLLHGADVVAGLEQVRREAVAQGVAGHPLDEAGAGASDSDRPG